MARPREAVGCRTLICRKADSGQLNDLATTRPGGLLLISRPPAKGTVAPSSSEIGNSAAGQFRRSQTRS